MFVDIGPYTDDENARKVVIRIDDYDTWNLDHTFSRIMLPAFIKFKENLRGWPANLDSTGPETEWNIILDKIIRAHTLLLDESIEQYLHDGHPLNMEVEEGLELMVKYWRNFWT